jgi:hypothetical protein
MNDSTQTPRRRNQGIKFQVCFVLEKRTFHSAGLIRHRDNCTYFTITSPYQSHSSAFSIATGCRLEERGVGVRVLLGSRISLRIIRSNKTSKIAVVTGSK